MTFQLPAEDQLAINEVITRFFRALDANDPAKAGDLFTESATLDHGRPGAPLIHGRDAIVEDMRKRPGGRVTRHIISGILIEAVSATHANVSIVNAIHAGPDDGSKVREEIGASDTALVLRKESDGKWRFDDMRRTVIFKPQR